jgi:hypothetical protein
VRYLIQYAGPAVLFEQVLRPVVLYPKLAQSFGQLVRNSRRPFFQAGLAESIELIWWSRERDPCVITSLVTTPGTTTLTCVFLALVIFAAFILTQARPAVFALRVARFSARQTNLVCTALFSQFPLTSRALLQKSSGNALFKKLYQDWNFPVRRILRDTHFVQAVEVDGYARLGQDRHFDTNPRMGKGSVSYVFDLTISARCKIWRMLDPDPHSTGARNSSFKTQTISSEDG